MASLNNPMKILSNLKENFVFRVILFMSIILIICVIIYSYYISSLNEQECKYTTKLYDTLNGKIRSISQNDPVCGYKLYDYYIKTAYNCCNGGSFKNDYVNICHLKNILKQGVRGLDFEIYSVGDQPVVASSTTNNYYVKETYNSVPFSEVMKVITNYAFSSSTSPNPNDPIIIHLRIKSANQTMYKNFADLLKSYNQYLLGKDYSFENQGNNLGASPLLQFSQKIILVVDKSNSSFMDNQQFLEYVNITSNSIFMRALKYYDVKFTPDMNELKEFNKRGMTICIPDNNMYPTNPNGIIARENGCQMVAMCYQNPDNILQENNDFFDKAGYAFVLKPENLRYKEVTINEPAKQDPNLSYATRNVSKDYYNFQI